MSSTLNKHWKKTYCPLVLLQPQENINEGLDENVLPVMSVSELGVFSDDVLYELGPRTLIGVKDYVFDVTSAKEFSGPTGAFRVWASKDISYALTKFSTLEEDVDVVGYVNLPASELEILDTWVAIFLQRFKVVGKMTAST
ncbi:hypothetical protein B0H14DRAFT_3483015 [Mycena olivaceomarginata]|nr:hypothetical protein B0H14DRAFT_3483015 [Mycena olivaceomarginata]